MAPGYCMLGIVFEKMGGSVGGGGECNNLLTL